MDQPKLYRVARDGHRWGDVLDIGTLVLARTAMAMEYIDTGHPAVLAIPLENCVAMVKPYIIAHRILATEHARPRAFVYDPAVLEAVQ